MQSQFSISIQQITRPSWQAPELPKRASPVAVQEKYDQVMQCLRQATGAVNCAYIAEWTGYTTQSIRHLTSKLIESGLVKKIECGIQGHKSVHFKAAEK